MYYADIEAKKLLNENSIIKTQIKKEFGDLYENNIINSSALAEIVFNNQDALAILNKIVHPEVKIHYKNWCEFHTDKKYTIKEAAILFESGNYLEMDEIITVIAPIKVRINRVIKRDKTTIKKVKDRIKTQWIDEKKILLSNYIINNDDTTLLFPQILRIHENLLSKSK